MNNPPFIQCSSQLYVNFLVSFFSFSCIIVVYIICGILINKYVRHIEGKEAFPNYLFWIDFPFLVKVCAHK